MSFPQEVSAWNQDLTRWRLRLWRGSDNVDLANGALQHLPEFDLQLKDRMIVGRGEVIADGPAVAAFPWDTDAGAPTWAALDLEDGEALREIFFGAVDSIDLENGSARLRFSLPATGCGAGFCRSAAVVAASDLPGWLPIVAGEGEVGAAPLFAIQAAELAEDMAADGDVLVLRGDVRWPGAGRLQINDEVLEYEAFTSPGSQIGSELFPLFRPNPKAHRRGSRVVLLPGGALRWCVLDHPGTVLELRSGDSGGLALNAAEVEEVDLAGQQAMVYEAAQLPLHIRHRSHPVLEESPRTTSFWNVLPESNASSASLAFVAVEPEQGALLSVDGPLIAAQAIEDFSQNQRRFDRLEKLILSVEYSQTPFWYDPTRLRISVFFEGQEVFREITRGVPVTTLELSGSAEIAPELNARTEARPAVLMLDDVAGTVGAWSDAAAGLGPNWEREAVLSGGPGSWRAIFHRNRSEQPGALTALLLKAAVRNDAAVPVAIELEFTAPGIAAQSAIRSLAAGEETVVELAVTLPPSADREDLLGPDAKYELNADGAPVALRCFWLEAVFEADSQPASFGASSLPVSVQAAEFPLLHHRVELDVTPLLPPGAEWSFTGGTAPPVVRIELLDPPTNAGWVVNVRDVHWRRSVYAASSVRPTVDLWARVRDEDCRADGTTNPATALDRLLQRFGVLTHHGALAASQAACDTRGLGAAAVFATGRNAASVLRDLLTEALLYLDRNSTAVLLHAWPSGWTAAQGDALEACQIERQPLRRGWRPTSPCAGLEAQWFWIAKGQEALEAARELRKGRRGTVSLRISPSLLRIRPGALLLLPAEVEAPPLLGIVEVVHFRDGYLEVQLGAAGEAQAS